MNIYDTRGTVRIIIDRQMPQKWDRTRSIARIVADNTHTNTEVLQANLSLKQVEQLVAELESLLELARGSTL